MCISHFTRFCQIVLQVIVHILLGSDGYRGLCICSSDTLDHLSITPSLDCAVFGALILLSKAGGGSHPIVRKVLGRDQGPDILNWFSNTFTSRNCGIIDSK